MCRAPTTTRITCTLFSDRNLYTSYFNLSKVYCFSSCQLFCCHKFDINFLWRFMFFLLYINILLLKYDPIIIIIICHDNFTRLRPQIGNLTLNQSLWVVWTVVIPTILHILLSLAFFWCEVYFFLPNKIMAWKGHPEIQKTKSWLVHSCKGSFRKSKIYNHDSDPRVSNICRENSLLL